jgi:hypothetical protein
MAIFLKAVNYIAFYGLWCLCVMAGDDKRALWVIPIVLVYLVCHLLYISSSPKREAFLIIVLTLFGAVNESLLATFGVVSYAGAYWKGISWWTLSLWACFATTYWNAFSWLSSRLFLSSFFGAIAAPLCYVWIENAGELHFLIGRTEALLAIGALWAVVLPLSFVISRWIKYFREDV